MKFISYLRDGKARVAATDGEVIADLNDANGAIPEDIKAALAEEHDLIAIGRAALEGPGAKPSLSSVTLAPVVPNPGKILCLGLNYADHAAEGGLEAPAYPSVFMRSASSLASHDSTVKRPRVSALLDYEAELAVVIGRTAHYVGRDRALDHVFGYTCFNDITLRDYQMKAPTWTVGKNFDGTGSLGPWIVTPDELPDGATGKQIRLRLNGEIMQDANTAQMMVGAAAAIELLSEVMTLEPGDVIALGTPAGIGAARKPPVWMVPGDRVEVEIEGLGILCNTIVDEPQADVRSQRHERA
nr:fumarylacetoacetate hydrolase family protein [Sphingomonas sp. CDS-1]